jgi:flagellar hook-associated protein 2
MSTSGPAVSFSGLGSGIDTASIISALMSLERMPIDRIEAEKTRVKARQGVVQEINGLLGKLRDAAAAMYAPDALSGKTAKSADDTVATAGVEASAAKGTYNVTVTSLAQAHTTASTAGPPLVAGESLDITVGGDTVTVAVESGDTLQDFADRINGTADVGASASVVNDKLVLISKTSGTGGAITLGGSAAAGFGFATTQSGLDAAATINGLAVTSSGNTIENAINGVSLTLSKVGSTTITVGDDTAAAQKQAQAFVDAYNALISNINAATRYDAATKTAGTLQGDQTITSLGAQLRGIAGSAVSGLGGAYDSLAQIGIKGSREGTLTLDAAAFQAALAADPDAVREVFGRDDDDGVVGATDGIARQLKSFAATFSTDILSARLTGYTTSLGRLDDKIADLEVIMDLKEQRLRAQFTAMEKAVAQFQSQGQDLAARLAAF